MLCLAKTLKFCIIFSVKLAGPSQIAKITGNTPKNSKFCDELFLFVRAALTSMANSNWFIFSYLKQTIIMVLSYADKISYYQVDCSILCIQTSLA